MISCVYCGGAHERPADIKRCWAEHEGGPADTLPFDASAEPVEARPTGRTEPPATRAARPAVTRTDHHSTEVAAAARRGPAALGRHVIVRPGQEAPSDWSGADRVSIDADVVGDPSAIVERLRVADHERVSLVIELAVERPAAGVERREPYEVGVRFEFDVDELFERVFANAVDLRDPASPRWWLADRAVSLGAVVGGAADVVLPDGQEAWLDGGPLRHVDPIDGRAVVHAVVIEHGRLEPPAANVTAADLAPDQLAAVTHDTGSARIIAPAGSGKTRVLTERARHLIRTWNVPASAVCLVAFNKRAQEEMVERTADLSGLQVRTLNSIALAIVNGSAPFAPQDRRFATIDEPAVRRVLQRFVATPRRRNTDPLAPWIEALSLVRLGLLDPATVEMRYGGDVDGLADVFPHYQTALDRDRTVDFDGQIERAIRVLLTDPPARVAAQRACRVLLVDEFQDLTPAHLLLIRLLAGASGSVFAVGDDDQTIYGYNGADPGWLIDFQRWFPGAGDHPLEVNYRCPSSIVEVADRLLRHNRRRVSKTIRPRDSAPGDWRVADDTDPVDATAGAVREAIGAGAPPSDVAVLTRVNATLAPVQVALGLDGVAVNGGVGPEFADRTAVRAAMAWLRLASGRPFAPDDLAEALRRPSRSLHPRIAEWVLEQRDADGLMRLADRITNERDAAKLREFAGDVARLQAMTTGGATTERVVAALIDDVGLGGAVATLDDTRRGMNRGSQGDDLLALRQLTALHTRHGAGGRFETWLGERLAVRRSGDGVTLATVHRVKGQEWPHVVVHLAAADQYPHRLADDVEEERRLFHVAMTRASSTLAIVPGTPPSPFLAELTTEPPEPSELPVAPRARSVSAPPTARRDAPDHPLLDRSRVMAVEGMVLVDQDQEWTIVGLEPEAAVAQRGGATRRFRIGSSVETAGRQRGALGARPGDVEPESAVAFDLLRQFRDRARNGKPAYTVFDDKTLAAIAQHLPDSLDELARVKGVGPAKLEQYGDTVLGVVAAARGNGE